MVKIAAKELKVGMTLTQVPGSDEALTIGRVAKVTVEAENAEGNEYERDLVEVWGVGQKRSAEPVVFDADDECEVSP